MSPLKNILQAPATTGAIKGITAVFVNKNYEQSRSLCHKSKLQAKKVFRWPYETIPWNYASMLADPFTKRKFNENTKLVVVDGNVAAGKEEVAKRVADELGLLYLPPNLDLDKLYINEYGFDYRALNPLLPERLRICDYEMFHENPSRHSVIHMQHFILKLRLFQYFKALRHIYNTGQGVVLVRSCYSDKVFVEAMHNLGWLPTGYVRGDGVRFYDWKMRYNFIRNYLLSNVEKPHLVIYVDTPVDICLDRIKNDPDPIVRNSKALTREFLEEIESAYKDIVLPKYDYNGIVHTVSGAKALDDDDYVDLIDEIEAMNFEIDPHETRFQSWDDIASHHYMHRRKLYTSYLLLEMLDPLCRVHTFDIAGMGDTISNADLVLRDSLYEKHVAELGWDRAYSSNSKVHGFIKTLFMFEGLEKRLDRHMRLDFV